MTSNPNLQNVLSVATHGGELNGYSSITEELIFWALDYADCSSFYWLGESCGSVRFGKFLK